jgi:hypothetical protein
MKKRNKNRATRNRRQRQHTKRRYLISRWWRQHRVHSINNITQELHLKLKDNHRVVNQSSF